MPSTLAVAIVTYAPDLAEVERTLQSLAIALDEAHRHGMLGHAEVLTVDNGPGEAWAESLAGLLSHLDGSPDFLSGRAISGQGNVGYGRANNLALLACAADYLLVLNPDVIIDRSAVVEAVTFMSQNPEIGLLAPLVVGADGQQQFLCKRFPTVLDLALRGFAPGWLRRRFAGRLARYEMHDLPRDRPTIGVPIVSGCFMFFRGDVFRRLGGFDPNFFMYFEDFDLSLRAAKIGGVAFVPAVRAMHFGGGASRKGWRHIRMFVRSAWTFFGKHGWRWA